MSKRVIAYLKGGLGNQCFIYAAAKTLAKNARAELCFSLDYFPEDRVYKRSYVLDRFRIAGRLLPLRSRPLRIAEVLRYKLLSCGLRKSQLGGFVCDHPPFMYRQLPSDWEGDLQMDGYWHAYGYYRESMPELYDDFELSGDDTWLKNDEVYRQIVENEKAFFCHVRSYKEVPGHANGDMSAGVEYYEKALRMMHEGLGGDSVCFLFSDDLAWAQNRLAPIVRQLGQKVVAVESAPQKFNAQIRDFMLMRACTNGIVANSSYSGFAGVLADCGAQKRHIDGFFIRSTLSLPDYFPNYWHIV